MTTYDRLYIGGDWVEPVGTDVLTVHNPATGEIVGSTPEGTPADMDRAVEAARSALTAGDWVDMPAAEFDALYKDTASTLSQMKKANSPPEELAVIKADLDKLEKAKADRSKPK